MRLIDADVLQSEYKKYHDGKRSILIDVAPTIDAVEVVRCKDCKHWYSDTDTGMACEFTNMGQPKDGFCNWAERRTDD